MSFKNKFCVDSRTTPVLSSLPHGAGLSHFSPLCLSPACTIDSHAYTRKRAVQTNTKNIFLALLVAAILSSNDLEHFGQFMYEQNLNKSI